MFIFLTSTWFGQVLAWAGTRLLTVSLDHLPGSDPPVGLTPTGRPCRSLGILFHWARPAPLPPPAATNHQANLPTYRPLTRPTMSSHLQGGKGRARKISASLALEKKMLSIVDVFAVFPCP